MPGRSYLLCLAVPGGAYLVAEGPSAGALEPTGQLLARFLGVPLERDVGVVVTVAGRRRLLIGVLLYAAPVTAAITLLGLSIPDSGSRWVFPTTLAAIVFSQVGAILALLYYRRREPAVAATPAPRAQQMGREHAAVPLGEPERWS